MSLLSTVRCAGGRAHLHCWTLNNETGVYKVPSSGVLGKNIKLWREEGNFMGKNIKKEYNVGKGKGEAIPSSLEFCGCLEEYQVGKRGSGRKFWGRNQAFKTWGWGRISSCRELYTPCTEMLRVVAWLRSDWRSCCRQPAGTSGSSTSPTVTSQAVMWIRISLIRIKIRLRIRPKIEKIQKFWKLFSP